MSDNLVDARGKLCPVPLVMTKKVYDTLESGDQMTVVVDNDTSAKNVETFILDSGGEARLSKEGKETTLAIVKGEKKESGVAEQYCSTTSPHVIYISADRIGITGEDTLGEALVQAFLSTIKDIRPLPSHIIFIHRGVLLLEKGQKTAEIVKNLEESGISIVACGTCLDYFEIMDNRACGQVSNMYDILSLLTNAGHIIRP